MARRIRAGVACLLLVLLHAASVAGECTDHSASCGECMQHGCAWCLHLQGYAMCISMDEGDVVGKLCREHGEVTATPYECPELQCWERYLSYTPYVCGGTLYPFSQ